MSEKKKCIKCNLLIDKDSTTCPYCGYKQDEVIDKINNKKEEKTSIKESQKYNFFIFPSKTVDISKNKSLYLFLIGFLGIGILANILSLILSFLNPYLVSEGFNKGSGILNFASYFIIFGIMFIILSKDSFKIFKDFKYLKTYIRGIIASLLLIFITIIVNMIMSLFKMEDSVNNNEASINLITLTFPTLSIIVFGIIGPIVEELTYRMGLFNLFIKRRWLSYLLVCLVFGFLHFDFMSLFNFNLNAFINELLNIPSYLVAGILLSFIYEKDGSGVVILAHVGNNLTSIIMTLISAALI